MLRVASQAPGNGSIKVQRSRAPRSGHDPSQSCAGTAYHTMIPGEVQMLRQITGNLYNRLM